MCCKMTTQVSQLLLVNVHDGQKLKTYCPCEKELKLSIKICINMCKSENFMKNVTSQVHIRLPFDTCSTCVLQWAVSLGSGYTWKAGQLRMQNLELVIFKTSPRRHGLAFCLIWGSHKCKKMPPGGSLSFHTWCYKTKQDKTTQPLAIIFHLVQVTCMPLMLSDANSSLRCFRACTTSS